MEHVNVLQRLYDVIMTDPTAHCLGCELEHANQLGHSCLKPEDELLTDQLPAVVIKALSLQELAKLTMPYVIDQILEYSSQRARHRLVDTSNESTFPNEREAHSESWEALFGRTQTPNFPVECPDVSTTPAAFAVDIHTLSDQATQPYDWAVAEASIQPTSRITEARPALRLSTRPTLRLTTVDMSPKQAEVIDLTGDADDDDVIVVGTGSSSLFACTEPTVARTPNVAGVCPREDVATSSISSVVAEEVEFTVLDEDTLRGFSQPFTEEVDDDDDRGFSQPLTEADAAAENRPAASIAASGPGSYLPWPSIEAQRMDWWDDDFYV
ncbi:hypothetical protein BsWGS_03933 [Bradybaena similaris]